MHLHQQVAAEVEELRSGRAPETHFDVVFPLYLVAEVILMALSRGVPDVELLVGVPEGDRPTSLYRSEPRGSRPCSWPKLHPVAGSTGGCHVGYSLPSAPTTAYWSCVAKGQVSVGPGVQMP
jgi:hypothetical protein